SAAVQVGSIGAFVYVVDDEQAVQIRRIVAGRVDGPLTAVHEGLQAGERVVVEGTDRLREGGRVDIVSVDGTELAPAPRAAAGGKGAGGARAQGAAPAGGTGGGGRGAAPAGHRGQAVDLARISSPRSVATTLAMVALLLSGLLAYRLLPVSALPQVDYPTIQVTTLYPGASPDVMTALVTSPLERQFGQMAGLTQMTSSSSG